MHIVIIGVGGVGGYFAARLIEANNQVTLVARGKHYRAIQKEGLKLISIKGDVHVHPYAIVNDIDQIQTPDLVIIATKGDGIPMICKQLQNKITATTSILPLLNGATQVDRVAMHLDRRQIIGGLCKMISKIKVPGTIEHISLDPEIVFGELYNQKTERIIQIKKIFDTAGIKNTIAKDIQIAIWTKFLFISTISALGGLTRVPIGVLRSDTALRSMMINIAEEIIAVANATGIKLPEDSLETILKAIEKQAYETTTSLQRDIMQGKPSELAYQQGEIVALGKRYKVPTPVNTFVYDCLLPMENQARQLKRRN